MILPVNNVNNFSVKNNKSYVAKQTPKYQSSKHNNVSFCANPNFILVNECLKPITKNAELNHISHVLKTLGVEQLELGDNVGLARLLKSAIVRIKKLGFDVPSRIKCESQSFLEDQSIQSDIIKNSNSAFKSTIPAVTRWDCVNKPVIHFDPTCSWDTRGLLSSKTKDPRQGVFHETAHYLHMLEFSNNPMIFKDLSTKSLTEYEKEILKKTIGEYATSSPTEAVAEIFSRLVSGESFSDLHPEVFYIYSKYKGPMPHKVDLSNF